MCKKARQEKKVIQISNYHGYHQLDESVGGCFSPIDVATMPEVANRVKEKGQVDTPK
jgi:hypothetical protein